MSGSSARRARRAGRGVRRAYAARSTSRCSRRRRVAVDGGRRGRRRADHRRRSQGPRVRQVTRDRRGRRDGAARRARRRRSASPTSRTDSHHRPTSTAVGAAPRLECGARRLLGRADEREGRIAIELETGDEGADHGCAASSQPRYGDSCAEAALASSIGVAATSGARRVRSASRSPATLGHAERARVRSRAAVRRARSRVRSARHGAHRARASSARNQREPADRSRARSARRTFSARHPVERVRWRIGAEEPIDVRRAASGESGLPRPGSTLRRRPYRLSRSPGASTAHDAEGVPTRPVDLIAGGVLLRVPAQHLHRPPVRRGHVRDWLCGAASKSTPACGRARSGTSSPALGSGPTRSCCLVPDGPVRPVRERAALGHQSR